MQQDLIQQSVESVAAASGVTVAIAIVFAAVLVFVLAGGWLLIAFNRRKTLTLATAVRCMLLFACAYTIARVLDHLILDPRPYIVEHVAPLMPVASDNGFPSDHVLLAAALTASMWWLSRRALPLFALGTLCVLLGRLGVGAHHTLDVLGSIAIDTVVAIAVTFLPLPQAWQQPLLATAADAWDHLHGLSSKDTVS
ncbi:MAG: phosphatase PAP2 family protein [Chloroflexi bacterium]|nr:phosphatase PAP2 family protein [Chloroflexota bacterium]